jgi:hypothetical protein
MSDVTLDAKQGAVDSLGFPPGEPFELPLYGCNKTTVKDEQANLLVILSGIAVAGPGVIENPEADTTEGSLPARLGVLIETEYELQPADEFCGATAYVTLASIDNDEISNEANMRISLGDSLAPNTADVYTRGEAGQPPRVVLELNPAILGGDTAINRISYQLHVAIYRPSR